MAANLAEVLPLNQGEPDPAIDEGFAKTFEALVEAARAYRDHEVQPRVDRGWSYYDGHVSFEPAQDTGFRRGDGSRIFEGSGLVMTEVRDAIDQMLPELGRVFLGSERTVEFSPRSEEDVEAAEQATDWCNWIFRHENDGENLLLDSFLDWLVKFAAFKVWWETEEKEEVVRFAGVPTEVISQIAREVEVGLGDIIAVDAEPVEEAVYQPVRTPDGGVAWMAQPSLSYSGAMTRMVAEGHIRVELIPQDEFLIDGDAKCPERARFVGHDSVKLLSELVALGVPYEVAREHRGKGAYPGTWGGLTRLSGRRDRHHLRGHGHGGWNDESLEWVRVVEGVARIDRDGDGIAETYRVLALGDKPTPVMAFRDDSCGYVVGSPYRRPHRPIGDGVPERTEDLQDTGTVFLRAVTDNLNRSIRGIRETISSDSVTAYNDLQTWFSTKPIRLNRNDQLGFHVPPFVAGPAFDMMTVIRERASARTGISAAGAGLDPNALKGQTIEGASAIIAAPQSRMEYLIREFAVRIMRPLFKEILRLSVTYQDKPKTIRLRNKWVTMDPRGWNVAMDCEPRVGLGTGTRAERFLALQIIAAKQEQLMAMGSPLVDMMLYRNTLAAMAELAGEKDTSRYFKEVSEEELAALQQQAAQQAQQQLQQQAEAAAMVEGAKAQARGAAQVQAAQATAQVKAQGDAAKAQADLQKEQIKGSLAEAKDDRKAALDLRIAGMQQRSKEDVELLKSAQDREEMLVQAGIDERMALMDHRLKLIELAHERELEEKKMRNQSRGGQGDLRSAG